jgi:hypothetical protein
MSIPDDARANFAPPHLAISLSSNAPIPRRASHATSYAPSDVTAATM